MPYEKNGSSLVCWFFIVTLFLPILVLPPSFQPSDWTRVMLFRVIVITLIGVLLFKFFYKKDLRLELPAWNTSLYGPLIILVAYFATLLAATVFSQDILFSIFGSPARAGGVLSMVCYFIFAVLLALFINKRQWQRLFHMLFAAGIMASLLALAQYFNVFKNIFIAYEGGSAPSFLGNSTILAIYMLFLTFLSFTFFIQGKSPKIKIAYGMLFLLFASTIFITGSRAAYLGLLAGFLYFFLFFPYSHKMKVLKIAAVAILLCSVLVVAMFNLLPQLGEKNNILKTVSSRVSLQRISQDIFGTRLSAWKMTWQAIKDRPLLGWGPENFYIGFEKYYDPTPFATPKLLWDKPHNIFLDVAVNSGIFSALLYIAFWIVLFARLTIAKRNQQKDEAYADNPLRIHALQAMFIGYLIVLFFNFDSFATYIISFFFIGYAFYLITLKQEKIALPIVQHTIFQKKLPAIAALAVLVIFSWFWNIKPLYLNEKIVRAKNLAAEKHCQQAFAIANSQDWSRSGIMRPYAIVKYSEVVSNCAFIEPEKEVEYSQKMVSLLKTAGTIQPSFSKIWVFMGSFTNVLAAREENSDAKKNLLREAIGYLQKAIDLSPGRQEAFAQMEKSYLIAQDYPAMEKTAHDCIAIDPRFGECYWHLGVAQVFLGNQLEGKKNVELAVKNGYEKPPYKQLAIAYMSQKNWKEAVLAYEQVPIYYENKEEAASIHAVLAFLYDKAGDYVKAGESALEVFKLQPENPETIPFIKLLLGKRPNDSILKSSLAFIYLQPGPQQELSKAKAIYLQLAADYPANASYRWELAKICYQLKQYDQAWRHALAILGINPKAREGVEEFIKTLPAEYWQSYLQR
ncbi:MAG: hypothetical protein A3C50_03635 [Candidatus Staskawiczbacteria bacterium RIFCSPHIGHO2_02_FULL_43_16]|uniref:O-antigen ligase-related domain-containing protein n=1 Tax=Candidatus Staskawiczbacteria bacterium RIFCSPHIGHO2_01_FULL_41_41 TaxID=1802203 RepID=A0A1G2HSK3_9BACT|nr:MAG: hypothetical protein A2822_02740 [Candidatus Staskawiczbacteria bacterium RIFCSPHIGHO2_01_FULL_41_41]OGZ68028.1 MAG: hypothetical protein A3C50_03635 [Candidatus Staskawiczbacteria bacterium RIFCSPHIGHO2_02_FULL_43_16]OGZ74594.1 MAG: hypothetical protein A3A12_02435 [Candidatus Staskawiczbacteria bacterium RIFCSPLOWO2_01_FULL_43_17b]